MPDWWVWKWERSIAYIPGVVQEKKNRSGNALTSQTISWRISFFFHHHHFFYPRETSKCDNTWAKVIQGHTVTAITYMKVRRHPSECISLIVFHCLTTTWNCTPLLSFSMGLSECRELARFNLVWENPELFSILKKTSPHLCRWQ